MMIRQHLNDFQIYLWPEELCFDNGAVRMKICILRYPHLQIFNESCVVTSFQSCNTLKNEFQFIYRTT